MVGVTTQCSHCGVCLLYTPVLSCRSGYYKAVEPVHALAPLHSALSGQTAEHSVPHNGYLFSFAQIVLQYTAMKVATVCTAVLSVRAARERLSPGTKKKKKKKVGSEMLPLVRFVSA
jgi:hypothetical protein